MRNRPKGKAVDVYGYPPNEITIKLNTADGKFSAEVKGTTYTADTLKKIKDTIKAVDEGVLLLQFKPYLWVRINDTPDVGRYSDRRARGHQVELQYERMQLAFAEGRCFSAPFDTPEAERPLKAQYAYDLSPQFGSGPGMAGTLGTPQFLLPYSEPLWEKLGAKAKTLEIIGRELCAEFTALAKPQAEDDPEQAKFAEDSQRFYDRLSEEAKRRA